jgi:hypothetical protein
MSRRVVTQKIGRQSKQADNRNVKLVVRQKTNSVCVLFFLLLFFPSFFRRNHSTAAVQLQLLSCRVLCVLIVVAWQLVGSVLSLSLSFFSLLLLALALAMPL